jgi:hypothetical protein
MERRRQDGVRGKRHNMMKRRDRGSDRQKKGQKGLDSGVRTCDLGQAVVRMGSPEC